MTDPPVGPNGVGLLASLRHNWLESLIVAWMLCIAVGFNLTHLYPEVAGDVLDGNDNVMHRLLIEAAVEAINQGRDFTDPWHGTMGMGFPLFHHYQHLPHLAIATVHVLTLGVFPIAQMLHWTTYILLSGFPLSIYWSLRRFGFDRISSAMGGVVASLAGTNQLYGFGYGSYVSSGFGLFTQLWGMVLLPPALAVGYRVLREGRGYFWATLLLAATLMSHLMYGYMAFLTLGVLTLLGPTQLSNAKCVFKTLWRRWRRLVVLFLLVSVVTSYFLVPFFLDRAYLNNSVWTDPAKYASYGHSAVLSGLVNGHLFDFRRFPSLTILVFVGLVICLIRWRNERYLIPISIFSLWILLYFGRATWGPLMDVLPLGRYLHMHRFIGGVHLGGIFLMAVALAAPWRWALSQARVWYVGAALALTLLVLAPALGERVSYLEQNALALRQSREGLGVEDQHLSALVQKLKQLPPGRIHIGQQFARGQDRSTQYDVGQQRLIRARNRLQAEGLDMVVNSYHRFDLNVDVLENFDERRPDHYNLYNARYVVALENRRFPAFVEPMQQFGRYRLHQVETTGYFDLVGSDLAFAGDGLDLYPAASSWLASELVEVKRHPVVSIAGSFREIRSPRALSTAAEAIPKISASASPSRGEVLSEKIGGNFFSADVSVERESLLLLKATYHRNWRATVDGIEMDTVMLMPSFVGVVLPPGNHQVRIESRPRRVRVILLCLGLISFALIGICEKWGAAIVSRFRVRVRSSISGRIKRRLS